MKSGDLQETYMLICSRNKMSTRLKYFTFTNISSDNVQIHRSRKSESGDMHNSSQPHIMSCFGCVLYSGKKTLLKHRAFVEWMIASILYLKRQNAGNKRLIREGKFYLVVASELLDEVIKHQKDIKM